MYEREKGRNEKEEEEEAAFCNCKKRRARRHRDKGEYAVILSSVDTFRNITRVRLLSHFGEKFGKVESYESWFLVIFFFIYCSMLVPIIINNK